MNLAQMYSLVRSKSYFSRSDTEIWAAINEGCHRFYQAVLKENRGYWIKTDTSTVALVPNVTEYILPADLEQILRVRERLSSAEQWRIVRSSSLTGDTMLSDAQNATQLSYDSPASQFSFYGPYETADTAENTSDPETYNIRFSPNPVENRQVEVIYAVKFIEVVGTGSFLIIPQEGRGGIVDFAVGELMKANGDTRAEAFYETSNQKLTYFLTLIRDRQLQDQRTIEPYIGDLD